MALTKEEEKLIVRNNLDNLKTTIRPVVTIKKILDARNIINDIYYMCISVYICIFLNYVSIYVILFWIYYSMYQIIIIVLYYIFYNIILV